MNFDIIAALQYIPGVVIGLTIHEYAHAFIASKLGDTTAKDAGRMTINPVKHIDPIGFLFLIIAGFGWAKPVMFKKENLKKPGRDESLIAISGPLSNLGIAILFSIIIKIITVIFPVTNNVIYQNILRLIIYTVYINYGLFVFNLIPLPPLDGSHLIFNNIKMKAETEEKIYRYGMNLLFAIIILGNIIKIDILPIGKIVRFIADKIFYILKLG
jgi:Zn-dependent protease